MPSRALSLKDETFDQQAMRTMLPALNAEVARKLGEIVVNIASRRSLPVAVSVVHPRSALFYCALEGSCADNGQWIRRKEKSPYEAFLKPFLSLLIFRPLNLSKAQRMHSHAAPKRIVTNAAPPQCRS
ncbi:hypothetical protein OKW45_000175 [Paraburkholderia sp. WSM4175]